MKHQTHTHIKHPAFNTTHSVSILSNVKGPVRGIPIQQNCFRLKGYQCVDFTCLIVQGSIMGIPITKKAFVYKQIVQCVYLVFIHSKYCFMLYSHEHVSGISTYYLHIYNIYISTISTYLLATICYNEMRGSCYLSTVLSLAILSRVGTVQIYLVWHDNVQCFIIS